MTKFKDLQKHQRFTFPGTTTVYAIEHKTKERTIYGNSCEAHRVTGKNESFQNREVIVYTESANLHIFVVGEWLGKDLVEAFTTEEKAQAFILGALNQNPERVLSYTKIEVK